MKKYLFEIIFYSSLLFLIISLIKSDYLHIPSIKNFNYLFISITFLFLGFIGNAIAWQKVLKSNDINLPLYQSIISQGLSIFAKYIPGKLWVILGRASYVSKIRNISKVKSSILSFNTQIITLWTGIFIGSLAFLFYHIHIVHYSLFIVILLVWLTMTLFLFYIPFQKIPLKLAGKFFKKEISISIIPFNKLIKTLPYFVLYWLCWVFGFFFLAASLTNELPHITIGFYFALAGSIGIIAIITPGGLGVREGILASLILTSDFSIEIATTIAVTSRIWFLLGEIFIFILAIFLKFYKSTNKA